MLRLDAPSAMSRIIRARLDARASMVLDRTRRFALRPVTPTKFEWRKSHFPHEITSLLLSRGSTS